MSEFLRAVRRIVVDFVVGRVLSRRAARRRHETAATLDDVTTYYLLHRHDFGMDDAPAGACILYAVSCNLSDTELANRHEILLRTGGLAAAAAEDDGEDEDDEDEKSGRRGRTPGGDRQHGQAPALAPAQAEDDGLRRRAAAHAPLIDQVHRLMHLWKAGDVVKVDDYLDARGLRKNALFLQLLQALIELAGEGTDERASWRT